MRVSRSLWLLVQLAAVCAALPATSTSSSATPSATALSCPGANGTTYTSSSGHQYFVQCRLDQTGGDLSSVTATDMASCITACEANTGCMDVSYLGNTCYLKTSAATAVYVLDAQLVVSSPSSSSSLSSSASSSVATSSSVSSSPASSSSTSSSSASSSVATSSSVSSSSASSSSVSSSSVSSSSASSSLTSSTQSSSLTSSSTVTTSTSSSTSTISSSSTVSSTSSSIIASATPISCPASNQTIYTVLASGHTFLIECGIDHSGGDMPAPNPVNANSLAACIAACDARTGCVDVSLSGSACYMKASVGKVVYDGVLGARLVTITTTSSSSVSTASSTTTSSASSISTSSSSSSTSPLSSSSSSISTVSSSTGSSSTTSSTLSSTTSTSSTVTSSSLTTSTTSSTVTSSTPSSITSSSSTTSTIKPSSTTTSSVTSSLTSSSITSSTATSSSTSLTSSTVTSSSTSLTTSSTTTSSTTSLTSSTATSSSTSLTSSTATSSSTSSTISSTITSSSTSVTSSSTLATSTITSTSTSSSSSATTLSTLTTSTIKSSSTTTSSVATTTTASSGPPYVMAHYIAGNANSYSIADWQDDMTKAQAAGIDAFGLDIAANDPNTPNNVAAAFSAAERLNSGFKLYIIFDYNAWGTWSSSSVISYINQYKTSPAYFNYTGKPLVSTFEGPGNAGDWYSIKSSTNCFFMPEWSSLSPSGALNYLNLVDGLASWGAWPEGPANLTTSDDMTYMNGLGSKPYMMPVSPWFYTNLPQYNKNWLWHSDSLWHYRWIEAITTAPTFVQIISWNDYGESHYIGPIRDSGVVTGAWYVDSGHDHQGWASFLPAYVSAFKSKSLASLSAPPSNGKEKINYWYKTNPSTAGSTDGTVGDASYQTQYAPAQLSADSVFFTVLLSSAAYVQVQIGSGPIQQVYAGTAGMTHFSVPMQVNGVMQTGAVTFNVVKNGVTVLTTTGPQITMTTLDGNTNWNPFVGVSS